MKYVLWLLMGIGIFACSKDQMGNEEVGAGNVINEALLNVAASDLVGYKIAFGDEFDIYMMNVDGSSKEKLTNGGENSGYVSWGPNANFVYFASVRGSLESAWEAYRVNVHTKELTKISNFGLDVRSLGVSPDGNTMAISVMTGNSSIGNNNDNLTQFSTNLYTVAMNVVESKISAGTFLTMSDLTAIQSAPNEDQFWFEELSWNHDATNPTLAYTKTWRYDEDDVSYTHAYTIKPDGTQNTLISENKDQPIWGIESDKLSFLDLSYYNVSDDSILQITVSGLNGEISGGSFSPGGNYMLFEIGDENRRAGITHVSGQSTEGAQYGHIGIYEPRWSPKPMN